MQPMYTRVPHSRTHAFGVQYYPVHLWSGKCVRSLAVSSPLKPGTDYRVITSVLNRVFP